MTYFTRNIKFLFISIIFSTFIFCTNSYSDECPYSLQAEEGAEFLSEPYNCDEIECLPLTDEEIDAGYTLQLPAYSSSALSIAIRGYVRDMQTREGIHRARVDGCLASVTSTIRSGEYLLSVTKFCGTCSVRYSHSDYISSSRSIIAPSGCDYEWINAGTTYLNPRYDPDSDGDGVPDRDDNCVNRPNGHVKGTCLWGNNKGNWCNGANRKCSCSNVECDMYQWTVDTFWNNGDLSGIVCDDCMSSSNDYACVPWDKNN